MKEGIIFIILVLLTLIFTFPLVMHIYDYCPGFSSTDELLAPVWSYWYWQYSLKHHLDFWSTEFLAYPFGMKTYGDFSPYLYIGLISLLSKFFNYIAVLNIQILLNFILTGFFTYLLVYYLTKNKIAALFSGIIFSFCPQHFIRSWQHISLSYFQWMPLYLFILFKLKEKPDFKHSILIGLALFLAGSFDLHYLFFMYIATILFVLLVFIYGKKNNLLRFAKYLTIGILVSFTLVITQFYRYIFKIFSQHTGESSAQNIFKRPFEDLFTQSARPLSYFFPFTEHPIFGGITKMFIGSSLYGDSLTEHNLYVGWVAILLALLGVGLYKKYKINSQEVKSESFAIKFFFILAIVSWFFSQPPWWEIGSKKIYMPSFFMYRILPMFRAYCRFGIVLMLAVAVLAGFGLKFILEKFKTQRTKIAITTLFCGLVLFEFWNWPPFKVIDVSKVPAVYYWLKEQPSDFVIAEYPLDIVGPNEMYKLYQTKHEKKIINATTPGTYAHKVSETITKLSDSNTAGVLKWMGVKYVLVHKEDYIATGLIDDYEELNKIPQNPRLKLIKSFPGQDCPQKDIMCVQKTGPIDVYEVVTLPIKPEPGYPDIE